MGKGARGGWGKDENVMINNIGGALKEIYKYSGDKITYTGDWT